MKSKENPDLPKYVKPEKPYHLYTIGSRFEGDIIDHIFEAYDDLLIYRVKGEACVSVYFDEEDGQYKKNLSKISKKMAELKACVCTKLENKKFARQIALIYKTALLGDAETAELISDKVLVEAQSFKMGIARLLYLISCFSIVALMLIFCVLQDNYFMSEYLMPYAKIMLFGSIGGFISVFISLKKLNLEININYWSQSVYGIFRITVAILSAIVSYLLIRSELILPSINTENVFVYYIFAVVAGFSETFIPNVLKKIEKDKKED
jgi:hypothetical protein